MISLIENAIKLTLSLGLWSAYTGGRKKYSPRHFVRWLSMLPNATFLSVSFFLCHRSLWKHPISLPQQTSVAVDNQVVSVTKRVANELLSTLLAEQRLVMHFITLSLQNTDGKRLKPIFVKGSTYALRGGDGFCHRFLLRRSIS